MAPRYEWFAWQIVYREDDWFLSLTTGQRWAWVAFLSYANESDFQVKKMTPELLSRRTETDPLEISDMISSAIRNGKITENETHWIIANGKKYRPDLTNAERQERHREQQKVTESNTPSQSVTQVTDRQDKTITRQDSNPPTPLLDSFLENWNKLAKEFPAIGKINTLTDSRKEKFKRRLTEPGFKPEEIFQAIRDCPFAQGKKQTDGRQWAVTFDWVIKGPENYIKLFEWAERDRAMAQAKKADEEVESQSIRQPPFDPNKAERLKEIAANHKKRKQEADQAWEAKRAAKAPSVPVVVFLNPDSIKDPTKEDAGLKLPEIEAI